MGSLFKCPSPWNSGPFKFQDSKFPLVGEARHYWNRTFVISVRYASGGTGNWNNLLAQLAAVKTGPPTMPYYMSYAFSTLHNDGTNLPFADGHVKHFSTQAVLDQKPF
jgi:prepilin-type processing-associated H-X9-DG protein